MRHAASGRIHRLTEINTEVSAKALAGPWRMVGTMRVDGMRSAESRSTPAEAGDGGMRLRIQAEPEVQKVSIESDGDLRFEDGATAKSAGDFHLAARRGSGGGRGSPPAKEEPGFRIKGKFALDNERLAVDEFRFETGPLDESVIRPAARFRRARHGHRTLRCRSTARRCASTRRSAPTPPAAASTLAERLAALQEALLDLPKPSIPGTLDVNLPAVVAGDTTVRDVRLSAEPATGGWTVKSLAATLPGRTTLEADGMLRTEGDLGFTGSHAARGRPASGFAAWVSQDVDDAIRRLPAAGFRADVDLTQERQAFSNLELGLGNATFRGQAERRQPSNAKPATVLKLAGGALDVDGLRGIRLALRQRCRRQPLRRRRPRPRGEGGPGQRRRPDRAVGGHGAEAARRPSGDRPAVDRRPCRRDGERHRHGPRLPGKSVRQHRRFAGRRRSGAADCRGCRALQEQRAGPGVAGARHGLSPVCSRMRGSTSWRPRRRMATAPLASRSAPTALQAARRCRRRSPATAGPSRPPMPTSPIALSGRNDDATRLLALYGLPVLPLGLDRTPAKPTSR